MTKQPFTTLPILVLLVLLGVVFLDRVQADTSKRAPKQAAPDDPAPNPMRVSGEIKKILPGNRVIISLVEVKDNALRETLDLFTLPKNCRITLDGRTVPVTSLKPGYYVTMRARKEGEPITVVMAFRPQVARRPGGPRPGVRLVSHEPAEIKEARERAKLLARRRQRLIDLQLAYASYLEQLNASRRARMRNDSDDMVTRTIFKIIAAGMANYASKELAKEENLFSKLFSLVLKQGRDQVIESCLKDVFPKLNDVLIRALRRTICLYLDDELSFGTSVKETAKEEIKLAIGKIDADLANLVEVVDFLYKLHQLVPAKK